MAPIITKKKKTKKVEVLEINGKRENSKPTGFDDI